MSVEALRAMLAQAQTGKKPTKRQLELIHRYKRQIVAESMHDILADLTQADYRRLAKVSGPTLTSHHDRLAVPMKGGRVNLPALLQAMHEHLSQQAMDNRGAHLRGQVDASIVGNLSDEEIARLPLQMQKIAYEVQNLRLKRETAALDLEKAQGNLISREEWKLYLGWLERRLAHVGSQLARKVNPEAQRIYNELLEGVEKDLAGEEESLEF